MADINLIKMLRDETQAPLKDIKEALENCNGDIDQARKYLKEKGLAKAAKRADRETNEGIVKIAEYSDKVVGIKLGCETDFVAKNEMFLDLAQKILDVFSKGADFSSISDVSSDIIEQINSMINDAIARIGENIRLIDAFVKSKNGSKVFVYTHPGDKIATVIFYTSNDDGANIAKDLSLQITAMNPTYISPEKIPSDVLDSMKNDFMAELVNSGKPANIVENIVKGKISKVFEEIVLTEQIFIKDETKRIKDILPRDFVILNYIRFSI